MQGGAREAPTIETKHPTRLSLHMKEGGEWRLGWSVTRQEGDLVILGPRDL